MHNKALHGTANAVGELGRYGAKIEDSDLAGNKETGHCLKTMETKRTCTEGAEHGESVGPEDGCSFRGFQDRETKTHTGFLTACG